jgi:hypothetical protein
MFTKRRARSLMVIGVLGAVPLLGCGADVANQTGAGTAATARPEASANGPASEGTPAVTARPNLRLL